KSDGRIKKNPARPLIEDLDSLPMPLYEQLPMERYGLPHLGKSVGITTSRGCPYSCTFCASSVIHGRKSRFRSIGYILEEIAYLKKMFSVNTIIFCDDTFETDTDRIFELCNQLINRRLNIKWCCTCRANGLPEELLKIMKASGCRLIHIGIESGNQEILDKNSKGVNLRKVEETVRRAKRIGLELYGYFMVGLPYETEKTIRQTIKFSQGLDLDYAQFSMLTPLPGTDVWKMMKEGKVLSCQGQDWSDFKRHGRGICIELQHVSHAKLKKYYRMAYSGFYLRPAYIWKNIKKIKSLSDFRRIIKLIRGMFLFVS
ncbi:MAG: radical SAM protein, partial [Chloroflexota bacterium]|nr:radical SAM protein [Chloroflexota bacterium]